MRQFRTASISRSDRVSSGKDNWDNRCRLLCCENTYGSPGNNDIDLLPDKLGNDLGCALAASLCPSNLDRDGSTPLGLLAVPIVGVICSSIALGEPLTVALLAATALIIGGIAIGLSDPIVRLYRS